MRQLAVTCAAAAMVIAVCAAADNKAKAAKIAPAPGYGNADAISEDELRIYTYFLASDQLEGRSFPSRGYDTAALYVASHLAEWGLKPGGSTSGTNGPLQPYLMPIEMVARRIASEDSKLTLIAPSGRGRFGADGESAGSQTTAFEYGKQWTYRPPGAGRGAAPPEAVDVSGNLVFAGNGYVINKTKTNPYEGLDVKGKIIVVAGLPSELAAQQAGRGGRGRGGAAQSEEGPADAPDPLGEACTDYFTPEQYAARNGALAVLRVASFQQAAQMGNPNAGRAGRGAAELNGPPFQVKKFQAVPACPSAPAFTAGLELTNALFQGEKANGSQVFYAAGNNTRQASFALSARKTLNLKLAVHSEEGHGENVVGIVEGSDPALRDEYVLISAHLDHIGLASPQSEHPVNNGADDDGSGSSGLLAMAHAYAAGVAKGVRPKRSVIFLWNGGEEKGLWGSQYFAEFPPVDLSRVVADLNMDMIGRSKAENSVDPNQTHVLMNPGEILVVGPNISSDDLEHTIEAVNGNYQKLKLNHFYDVTHPDEHHDNLGPAGRGQRIFYRSDHYNFAKVAIPIAFFTTGLHPDYHRPTDTPDKIDYKQMQSVSRMVAAVAWELADQAGRPKLNANLPDDLKRDMDAARKQGWGKVTPVLAPLPGEPY